MKRFTLLSVAVVTILAVSAFLVFPHTTYAAIAFVNANSNQDYSGGSGNVTIPAFNLTAGNLVVVGFRSFDDGPPTVTDTAGNTYIQLYSRPKATPTGSTAYEWLGYCENCLGNASNVITAAGSFRFWGASYAQYSGISTSGSFDVKALGDTTSGTSVTSAPFTTTQANELIVAFGDNSSGTGSWNGDTGFNVRTFDGISVAVIQDKTVSSIQSGATVSYGYSATAGLGILVATFKATGGGGGGATNTYSNMMPGIGF